jgi:glutathione S-transferase
MIQADAGAGGRSLVAHRVDRPTEVLGLLRLSTVLETSYLTITPNPRPGYTLAGVKHFTSDVDGIAAEHVRYVSLRVLISKQETRTPEHLTLDRDGKVPVLVTESGRVLTEVAATLYYIARKYPASRLWPEGDLEDEAEVISWMSFAASTMHGSRARGSEHVANAFAVANRKLGDRQWAVGRDSIADIHLFRVYWRFRPCIDAPPGTYPALEAHHDRMLARPAV